MWYPTELFIRNLFTHKKTVFNFKQNEMIMLIGENRDIVGANSNGSGKSSIIEAVTLAITGDVYRGVDKANYIRSGEDECEVQITLKNDVLKEEMLICRTIYLSSKSSKFTVLINGSNNQTKEFDRMSNELQKFIWSKLGITQEDFLNYYVIGQGNVNNFFVSGDAAQKKIISRFSNANMIDKVSEIIDEEITNVKFAINKLESYCLSKQELVNNFQFQIEDLRIKLKNNSDDRFSEKDLANVKAKADRLVSEYASYDSQVDYLEKIYEEKKNNEKGSKVIGANNKLIKINEDRLDRYEDEVLELNNLKGTLSVQSGKVVKCPNCGWKFVPDSNLTSEQIKESSENVNNLLEQTKSSIRKLRLKIKSLKDKNEEIKRAGEESRKIYFDKLVKLREEKNDVKDKILKLNKEEIEIRNSLQQSDTKNLKKVITELEERITEFNKEIKQYNEDIEQHNEELERWLFNKFHFSSKGFKTYLANKCIKNIEDITNYYLDKFGTDLRVEVNGYKILKNGDLRDKVTINVNGGPYKRYSGGEKARVAIAGVIALQKLLNNSSVNGGLNMLLLDEFMEGLDESGQEQVVKMFGKVSLTSVLVMHHSSDIQYQNKIIVVKQNNVSKIIN